MKKNFILKILKCTEMHYKSWFEAFFCEVFLTIAVAQLHFLNFFSVVEVCGSLQKLSELRSKDDWETSSGTILLYSRNLPNIVTISAKHQILRCIGRKNKLCITCNFLCGFEKNYNNRIKSWTKRTGLTLLATRM